MILREIKNIYVPKIQQIEYLESTGTQYIDTEFKHNNNTRFVTLLSFQSVSESEWNYPFGAFGDYNKRSIFALESDYEEILYSYYGYVNAKKSFNQKVKLNYLYNIDFNKNTHTINDTSVVHDTSNFSSIYNTFIFASSNYNGTPTLTTKVRCYYFQIYDNGTLVRDFIPVRIGTKGYMLDKVSGELYGNSGTGDFILGQDVGSINYSKNLQQIYQNKLIEGVDYETADWLKADIPIGTSMMRLSINSKNFEFKRNFIQLMNSSYFIAYDDSQNSYHYLITGYDDDPVKGSPQIWSQITQQRVELGNYIGLGIHTIIANNDGVSISGNSNVASLPWYGNPTSIAFNNSNNQNIHTICLTSSIKVDGVTRYVPCQLLRSIPRNLDAQCKERVAGECGMIDLISGKFYGNVASSGTFTVENDNNE